MTSSIFRPALMLLVLLTLVTGILYPFAITGLAQLALRRRKADGSIIERNGVPVASRLIGQNFSDTKYFWSRPSATATLPYNGVASRWLESGAAESGTGGCGEGQGGALRAAHPDQKGLVPVDLVTASTSGLDPHESVAAALYQVERVAKARNLSVERVKALVAEHTEGRFLRIFGEPRVNVVELNLALDAMAAGAPRFINEEAFNRRAARAARGHGHGLNDARPDPDQLLAHVQAEEARAARGRLRIFFGSSAGVGKTYAMLEAARTARATGIDVVVGYVEPHGRVETERLLEGLERLSLLAVRYRGIVRQEFDLDAALKRRLAIVLVDELAHSNLVGGEPPPRHPKRWQDVEELLHAGINVWTTVNVQHIESLNDLIAQTSGVRQRETIPDRVFDEADEVELIDLPPEDLLARLRAGKIYIADEAATAVDRFFRKSNLLALRELALRRVADRVEAAARASASRTQRGRLAADRVMVAIGPDEQAEQLVRAGKRMADALDLRVDRRVRRDTRAAAPFGGRAQPAHRSATSGGVARRGDRDARWPSPPPPPCSNTRPRVM